MISPSQPHGEGSGAGGYDHMAHATAFQPPIESIGEETGFRPAPASLERDGQLDERTSLEGEDQR